MTVARPLSSNDIATIFGAGSTGILAKLYGQNPSGICATQTPPAIFDVVQYGAVFDGATSVRVGVQAAIDAARTYMQGGNFRAAEIRFPSGGSIGRLYNGETLNFTGFTDASFRLKVIWNDICILASTNGTPVIDALGSMMIWW